MSVRHESVAVVDPAVAVACSPCAVATPPVLSQMALSSMNEAASATARRTPEIGPLSRCTTSRTLVWAGSAVNRGHAPASDHEVGAPGAGNARAGDLDEDVGPRRAGGALRDHSRDVGEGVALAAVAGGAGGDDVLPAGVPAFGARDHVVDRQLAAGAAVLAGPVVAGEDRAAGDLAAVRVAGDAHVADEPDHDRPRNGAAARMQHELAVLEHLGLLLQEQHDRPSDGADVDRLERRVQYEHPARLAPAPLVLQRRRGRPLRWWY